MTERPKTPREPISAREPLVLIVEDDELMREALSNLFASIGLEVEVFADSKGGGEGGVAFPASGARSRRTARRARCRTRSAWPRTASRRHTR